MYIWAGIKSGVSPGFPGSFTFKCPITLVFRSVLHPTGLVLMTSTSSQSLYLSGLFWVASNWNSSQTSFAYGLRHLGRVIPRFAQALKSCRIRVLEVGAETHRTRDLSLFLSALLVLASFCSKFLSMWQPAFPNVQSHRVANTTGKLPFPE